MKNTTILAIAVALVTATSAVQAAFINGTVSFAGTSSFDTISTGSATEVTTWRSTVLLSGDGDYSSLAPFITPVTITAPWLFNSGSVPSFVSFAGYTFDLFSSSVISQTVSSGASAGVAVSGIGVVSGNGYNPTVFSWSFSSTGQESGSPLKQSFQASLVSLPDGGTTVALLGGALTALGLIRRKLVA